MTHAEAGAVTVTLRPKARSVAKRLAPGIYTHGTDAYRFFARVRGKLHSTVFRPPMPLSLTGIKDSYRGWRGTLLHAPDIKAHRGTFAADVQTYLSRVAAMPTYAERERHLGLWLDALGRDRPRGSITPAEIDVVLQGWLRAGLAPQTVRLRRNALLHVWNKLDGKAAPNPVRGAEAPKPPQEEDRSIPLDIAETIFAAMRPSQGKTRLRVIVTAGIPHKQLKAIKREHIDWERRRVFVTGRRKGRGAAGGWRPVTQAAMHALKDFDAQQLYGEFSNSTVYRMFKLACEKAGVVGSWTPYGLRHSFGALAYDQSSDLATTARLLGHAQMSTARRYAMAAERKVDARTVDLIDQQLPADFGAKVGPAAKMRSSTKSHMDPS